MSQQPMSLVPAHDLPLGHQIVELGRSLTTVNGRLMELTHRLNEWTSAVENALRDTEGAKIDFGTWASGIENRLGNLSDRIHMEVTERQGCQQGHERDVGKLWEMLDNMKEEMLNQMTDGDLKNSNAIGGLRQEIVTKIDTRINAVDAKLMTAMTSTGNALKKNLIEHAESSKAELIVDLEELKGKIVDVRGRLELMETVKTEMSSMSSHKASQLAARVTEVNERITDVQTQMLEAIDEKMQTFKEEMLSELDQRVQASEAKVVEKISQESSQRPMTGTSSSFGLPAQLPPFQFPVQIPPASSTATMIHPPAAHPMATPVVPPVMPPTPRVNHVRWTKHLTRLSYGEVKTFVTLFKAYLQAAGLSEAEAKLTLLQSLEGEALKLLAGMSTQMDTRELLEQLMKRVRPSDTVLEGKLLKIKQRPSEAVQDYFNRFQLIASDLSGYSDERKRDVFMNNLNATWKMTARSLWLPNKNIPLTDLAQGLMDLEGSDYADKMEIDHVGMKLEMADVDLEDKLDTVDIAQVVTNGRIDFREVRDPRSLMYAWRQLCRTDRDFKAECLRWLNNKPAWQQRRPNFNGPERRDNRGGRKMYHVQGEPSQRAVEEPYTDDIFNEEDVIAAVRPIRRAKLTRIPSSSNTVKVLHRSKKMKPRTARRKMQPVMESVNTMKFAHKPLMYANVKLNNKGFQALVDTGASTSILPRSRALKLGVGIDQTKSVDLLAFDGSVSKSAGVATLTVAIGDTCFDHEFCVVPMESKIIFGNDIWTSQKVLIDPAKNQLRLATNKVVLCQAVLPKEMEDQEKQKKPKVKLTLIAKEKLEVDPVIREDLLLIPAGRSFVIPARCSRTMLVPMQCSRTVPVFDSGRLPPGIITSTTMWAKQQRLRLTIVNTTSKSIMIGSKSAVGCVQIGEESEAEIVGIGDERKLVRRV